MPLKINIPERFTAKNMEYRYLNEIFDIEKKFNLEVESFVTSDMVDEEKAERNEALELDKALWFFVFLSIGKIEAVIYLADCCNRNMGFTATSTTKYRLANFIANLGATLGDTDCRELAENMTTELETAARKVAGYVEDFGKYFTQLQNEGKPIYLKDVLGYAKILDSIIKNVAGFSYLDNMPDSEYKYFLSQTQIIGRNQTEIAEEAIISEIMAEKAEEHAKLFAEFKSTGFQAKLATHNAQDAAREVEIDRILEHEPVEAMGDVAVPESCCLIM